MYFQWKYIPNIFFFIIYTKTFLIALVRLTRKEILKCRKKQSFLASVPSNNIGYWLIESRLVVSNSLQPHGLYSTWNSPGQNTGVGSLSLFQGIFPTQGLNPHLPHDWLIFFSSFSFFLFLLFLILFYFIFTIWATGEAQEYWSGQPSLSPAALPKPGNEPGFTTLQADSLLLSYQGSPLQLIKTLLNYLHHCWKCMNSSIKRLVRICRALLSFVDICFVL